MLTTTLLLTLAATTLGHPGPAPESHADTSPAYQLFPRATGDDPYQYFVCQPKTVNPTDTVPPCIEIATIEQACKPNGTSGLYLVAHQECMCHGSYFTDWVGCLDCLAFHGFRNGDDVAFYQSVLAAASSTFCDVATPAAPWASVFASAQGALPPVTTGDTVSSDHAVSQTAVSLYWTASGSQGPGAITGSAALATANSTSATGTGTGTGTAKQTGTTTTGSSTGSTTSSTSSSTKPSGGNAVRAGWGWSVAVVVMVARMFML